MTALLFAMVGSFLVAAGARDQKMVAYLRAALGASPALLGVGIVSAVLTAAIAAYAGAYLSATMSEDAATMFIAIALLLAAAELAWPDKSKPPAEPTRSLGAIFIVLFARQLTDGSRFLIAAFSAVLASPVLAGIGGALGGAAAVAVGWAMGSELEARLPLRAMRLGFAALLLLPAIYLGLSARGIAG
ncbi:TMEM165/GDT1 family protein [Qipengyuania marisflavi]|nr:TMEM165/GDT1 family protein [Qipengyuania marisflavi]